MLEPSRFAQDKLREASQGGETSPAARCFVVPIEKMENRYPSSMTESINTLELAFLLLYTEIKGEHKLCHWI
jgi:hypothetical protein